MKYFKLLLIPFLLVLSSFRSEPQSIKEVNSVQEFTYIVGWDQNINGNPSTILAEDTVDMSKGDELIIHFVLSDTILHEVQSFGVGFENADGTDDLTPADIGRFTGSFTRDDNPVNLKDACGISAPYHPSGSLQWTSNYCYRNPFTDEVKDLCLGHTWTVRLKLGKGNAKYHLKFQIHGTFG